MIQISIEGGPRVTANLQGRADKLNRSMVRAINRTIGSVRTVMVREMSRDLGLKSKDVRDALSFRQASLARTEAALGARLKRMPLIDFKATGPEPSHGKGRGVAYKLSGARDRIENAFIATMPSGHRGVFVRKAKARLAIRELFGPSLGRVFAKYRPVGIARGREVLVSNLQHELAFAGDGGSVEVSDDAS
jgi:hypothetical protein